MQDLEKKFLLLSVNFIQWKEQSLKILELTYENMSYETDNKEKEEEYKKIKNKIEEKTQQISEYYVKELKSILPYQVKYKNFKEAINHLEKIYKKGD